MEIVWGEGSRDDDVCVCEGNRWREGMKQGGGRNRGWRAGRVGQTACLH